MFREIVAVANAQGGTLILGIDETDEKPPRAAALSPISRVHDLASRLADAARACIDPSLGSFQVCDIAAKKQQFRGYCVLDDDIFIWPIPCRQ